MNIEYIIVQAGGKGTRLEYLTKNKPKALVPVDNLPMLFHLFKQYSDKRFIIIGDYKKEVLKKYLSVFAKVSYEVVDANGTGTCGGIKSAIDKIPNKSAFMLIWSDLILKKSYVLPDDGKNYVGISKDFICRWSYKDNEFIEEKSSENGVAGMFIFTDKKLISDVPSEGEFVRYLSKKDIDFLRTDLYGTCEFGTLEEYKKLQVSKCRPFNKITIKDSKVIKEPIDNQGKELATKEINWYKKVSELGFNGIPNIYSYKPLVMDYIDGKNIYEYNNISITKKKEILKKIVSHLNNLHFLSSSSVDKNSVFETYITKTFNRLDKIQELIPFANNKYITINGRKCKNIYYYKDKLIDKINRFRIDEFKLIHGDCTFSNIMLDKNNNPVLIDPRGYFGNTLLYGDINYDWAKLYYSLVGNYDMFNLKRFRLSINEKDITLQIESSGWEKLENDFFNLVSVDKNTIKLIHAIIWLSLTTYAWQDYDSICGAFYNGLYYLEEVL